MKKLVLLLAVLFVLSLNLALSGPASAKDMRLVTLFSPPLAYEKDGEVTGTAVEVVREGLRRMGLLATIEIMPWKRAVFMTRFGEADALFYAVRTEEREKWFHYPDESLVIEATVAIKRRGGNVSLHPDKTENRNIRLGVGRGYYYGPKLEAFLKNSHFMKVEEATTIESNFHKLLEGRIDVFLSDLALARHFIKKRASRDVIEIVSDADGHPVTLDSVESYLVFSRETVDADVARRFGEVLREMKADGTYEQIEKTFR